MIALIIQLFVYSFIATAFFLPVSALDVYYVTTFNINTIGYILPLIISFELVNAIIVYTFSNKLSKLVIRSDKNKAKLEKVNEKIEKYGFWGIVAAGATPLPYSLVLYSLGATQWGSIKQLSIAVLMGRSFKYVGLGLLTLLGISIFI